MSVLLGGCATTDSGSNGASLAPAGVAGVPKKDTSVILLWLDGGPSHLDLYDLKPEAPPEVRGIWNPIQTNVPGFDISEMFPLQAKVADKFSLVRSLHHDYDRLKAWQVFSQLVQAGRRIKDTVQALSDPSLSPK